MNRREAMLAIASGLMGASAGCTGSSGRPSRRELPDRPELLNAQSAVDYVLEYEEAYGYNEQLVRRDNLVSKTYSCDGALEVENQQGYYVSARCGFSSTVEYDDGNQATGSGLTDPILYFISSDTLVRRPTVFVRTETDSESVGSHGIRLVNLSDEERVVCLDISYDGTEGDSDPVPWFPGTFDLHAERDYARGVESGYTLLELSGLDGVYSVTVNPDDGPAVTHDWTVPGSKGPDITQGWSKTNVNPGVYITPNGGIRIFNLSPEMGEYGT